MTSAGASTRPVSAAEREVLSPILADLGLSPTTVERFVDRRWEKSYDVYACDDVILKRGTANELALYQGFLDETLPIPQLRQHSHIDDDLWLVFAAITGDDLQTCTDQQAADTATSLARVHDATWREPTSKERNICIAKSLPPQEFWHDLVIARIDVDDVVQRWRQRVAECPFVLSHNDLLPMNVIHDGRQAWIIDWAHGASGPYFTDLGRFFAFAGEIGFYTMSPLARERFVTDYCAALPRRDLCPERVHADVLLGMFREVTASLRSCWAQENFTPDAPFLQQLSCHLSSLADEIRAANP